MKIFGWSNAVGGVHHYRIREPLRGLARLGHETKTLPAATADIFEQWDIVLVRGLHHPQNSLLWRWAAQIGKPALRVYDLDDDIWGWNPGSKEYDYWTDDRRESVEMNIICADLVTTPTDPLAAVLIQLNPNVVVLPNTIPERLLHWLPPKRDRFVVGWQGAEQHVKDLQVIYTSVLRFMLRHSEVDFHVWGPHGIMDFPDALAGRIFVHPWTTRVWDHYTRLSMDIGLAPLDTGDRFNETKSDIRLREYAALGIPFIASRSVAYSGTTLAARGILAEDGSQWEGALERLFADSNTRAFIAEQGRHRARLWTTEANAIEWERAYVRAGKARDHRNAAAGNGQANLQYRPAYYVDGERQYVHNVDTEGRT